MQTTIGGDEVDSNDLDRLYDLIYQLPEGSLLGEALLKMHTSLKAGSYVYLMQVDPT